MNRRHRIIGALAGALAIGLQAHAKSPECDSLNNWAASTAFVYLKNAHITSNDKVDFSKTHVVRLASEKVGKDLYRQIHLVTYAEKSGREFEVITVNDASSEECSMSRVEAYLVAQRLGRK